MACKTSNEIEHLIISHKGDWNLVNVATAFRTLSKHHSKSTIAKEKLLQLSIATTFPPRNLSNIVHAIARGRMFESIPPMFVEKIRSSNVSLYSPQAISNSIWAFAKLEHKESCLTQKFADEIVNRDLKNFNAQALSNSIWAFATLGFGDPKLSRKFGGELVKRDLKDFNPQDISNSLWAFATLDFEDSLLTRKFADEIVRRDLEDFTPQALSNSLWAFAALKFKDPKLTRKFADEMVRRGLKDFNPQALANPLWAVATLDFKDPNLIRKFANEIGRRDLQDFNPQGLANSVWAFATLGFNSPTLAQRFVDEIAKRELRSFTPQALSNFVWAFGKFGFRSEEVCQKVADEVVRRDLSSFDGRDMSILLHGFGSLGFADDRLVSKIAGELCRRPLGSFSPQSVVNLAWSFACLDVLRIEDVVQWFMRESTVSDDFKWVQIPENARQMFQTRLAWSQLHPGVSSPLIDSACKAGWVDELVRDDEFANPSGVQLQIFHSLEDYWDKSDMQSEAILLHGISVDIFFPSRNAVVEVDGPYHFLHDGRTMNGATRFKHRLLSRAGFTVFPIHVETFSQHSSLPAFFTNLARQISKLDVVEKGDR